MECHGSVTFPFKTRYGVTDGAAKAAARTRTNGATPGLTAKVQTPEIASSNSQARSSPIGRRDFGRGQGMRRT